MNDCQSKSDISHLAATRRTKPAIAVLLVLSASAQALHAQDRPQSTSGTGRPTVTVPRLEAEVAIDGVLDEPAWARAARLGGFSQYQPVDGRPAEEQTEVLVWYSPEALHFGIVAHDRDPSTVRATVAERDDIDRDDSVTLYLDTFNDRRRAFFFAVNPLGAQQDGVQSEGTGTAGQLFGGNIDKNPDYKFDSNLFFGPTRIWTHGDFLRRAPIEGNEMARATLQMRGGWQASAQIRRTFVRFDRAAYRNHTLETAPGVRLPFDPPAGLSGTVGTTLTVTTPNLRLFNVKVEVQRSQVPIFPEAAEGRETRAVTNVNVRPTGSIRIELSHTYSRIARARDGSEFARTTIPRLRIDVQPRRSLFVRTIGEYRAERQSRLVDPRGGALLFVNGVVSGAASSGLHVDWLLSFEPTPGTAVFVGYGAELETPNALRQLERTNDRVFVKLAYQFRR